MTLHNIALTNMDENPTEGEEKSAPACLSAAWSWGSPVMRKHGSPACLPACPPACLPCPTYPACLPACPDTCLPPLLPARLPACLPATAAAAAPDPTEPSRFQEAQLPARHPKRTARDFQQPAAPLLQADTCILRPGRRRHGRVPGTQRPFSFLDCCFPSPVSKLMTEKMCTPVAGPPPWVPAHHLGSRHAHTPRGHTLATPWYLMRLSRASLQTWRADAYLCLLPLLPLPPTSTPTPTPIPLFQDLNAKLLGEDLRDFLEACITKPVRRPP